MIQKIKNFFKYRDKHKIQNIFITILGSFLYALGIKWFIIPAGLYTGGFTGIAQLLSDFVFNDTIPVSIIWMVLNLPVFYLGIKAVGRRFTFLSILFVAFGSLFLQFLPVPMSEIGNVINDKILSAIIGGVIAGIGVGFTLKVGASTGGMDIVSQYLSYRNDKSVGQYSFVINVFIVFIAGFTQEWTIAFYTIINLFISTVVIDRIHTRHHKLTLMIVTDVKDELVTAIQSRIVRGITIIPAQGAYTKNDKSILFMVVSSYELYNIVATIREVDPKAFTNVLKSQFIFGNFLKNKVG